MRVEFGVVAEQEMLEAIARYDKQSEGLGDQFLEESPTCGRSSHLISFSLVEDITSITTLPFKSLSLRADLPVATEK